MVSMLRRQGVPARMRVGYATYTWGEPKLENHFIVEYFNGQRWVLLDAQMDQAQREFPQA
jgi:transglutaminase-like putative cysteine protease